MSPWDLVASVAAVATPADDAVLLPALIDVSRRMNAMEPLGIDRRQVHLALLEAHLWRAVNTGGLSARVRAVIAWKTGGEAERPRGPGETLQ